VTAAAAEPGPGPARLRVKEAAGAAAAWQCWPPPAGPDGSLTVTQPASERPQAALPGTGTPGPGPANFSGTCQCHGAMTR